jgi:hypothetical protein
MYSSLSKKEEEHMPTIDPTNKQNQRRDKHQTRNLVETKHTSASELTWLLPTAESRAKRLR